MGRAAEFEQDVEAVCGDAPGDVGFRQVGQAAERGDTSGDLALHRVGGGGAERVGVNFETVAIVVLENRQGEVTHRMVAQVGGDEADADARAARGRMRAQRFGLAFVALTPLAVAVHQGQPVLQGLHAAKLGMEGTDDVAADPVVQQHAAVRE